MRRFDRIEKELGYCEVKLEKEERLKKQKIYLQADVEALDEVLKVCREKGVEKWYHAMHLDGIPIVEIPQILRSGPKPTVRKVQKAFMILGSYVVLKEEREILKNELEDLNLRLSMLTDFSVQHDVLEKQRELLLEEIGLKAGNTVAWGSLKEFDQVEQNWHQVSEDLANLETTLHHLSLNLDCLLSGRNYLLSAGTLFDIQQWTYTGTFADLVRHSPVGRAYEMVHGADVNIKLAEKEMICIKTPQLPTKRLAKVLAPFTKTLFEDIFVHASFRKTRQLFEDIERGNRAKFEVLKMLLGKVESQKYAMEEKREKKYMEIGKTVNRLVCN